jgi:S-adenosylmethionine-diacylglycerol 3-amino-3-carboxypropyl transferase
MIAVRSEWVDRACRLPVAFAQVREDALQDLWLAERQHRAGQGQGRGLLSVLLTASGGCTAAALAASGRVEVLHLVDANPAQLALARLKLHLLQNSGTAHRLRLLGHAPMPVTHRAAQLREMLAVLGLGPDVLGPPGEVAERGPDYCGRYERLFAALREDLAEWRDEVKGLLDLRDPVEQARRAAPESRLGAALDRAFDAAFDLDTLGALFGQGATANRLEPFARHFAHRTRHVLGAMPAASNPYLWQLLEGRYPPGCMAPWLSATSGSALPAVTWAHGDMDAALAQAPPGEFDMVHLSNILDWLSPDQARITLEQAFRVLRPGGIVVVRQLNSALDVRACGGSFSWDPVADQLHARDRSFFYRALHIGVKP